MKPKTAPLGDAGVPSERSAPAHEEQAPSIRRWRELVRFDGLWWRKFARLGSVYGPEWWKRCSPPLVALVIFVLVGRNRRGAIANQGRVLGSGARRLDTYLAAYRVFARFARCLTETLEFLGPRPKRFRIDVPPRDAVAEALARGRGVVLVTAHVGNWDVSARALQATGRPVNLVMAREANETTQEFALRSRVQNGVRVILSDSSIFSSFNMIRALRRNEILAMQLDRGATGPDAPSAMKTVPFLGGTARFQEGPFHLARLSGAPVIPVFTLRRGLRHYEICLGPSRTVAKDVPGDAEAALWECVSLLERTIREHPDQWFEFAPFCVEDAEAAPELPARR